MQVKEIKISNLRTNSGQIEGLPRNPRKISKKMLKKLKKSVQDAPEMLQLRELIVVDHPDGPVVICGNQRLEAAKALGWDTLPAERVDTLRILASNGVKTWVSFEPVIFPEQSLNLLSQVSPFIDHVKIGKMNYMPGFESVDWSAFLVNAVDICRKKQC